MVAGDPEQSGLLARMKIRGSKDQMPSLATEIIDPAGVEAVTRWIAEPAAADRPGPAVARLAGGGCLRSFR